MRLLIISFLFLFCRNCTYDGQDYQSFQKQIFSTIEERSGSSECEGKRFFMEAVLTGKWGVLGESPKDLFKTNCTVLFKTTFQFPPFVPVIFVFNLPSVLQMWSLGTWLRHEGPQTIALSSVSFFLDSRMGRVQPSTICSVFCCCFFCRPSASCKTSDLPLLVSTVKDPSILQILFMISNCC